MSPAGYAHQDEVAGSARAAEVVVPLVLGLVGPVRSVADVGGGTGAWLRAFRDRGATDLLLLDAPAVAPHLLIDPAAFRPTDLNAPLPPPPRRFDLAVSVECGEHLRPAAAPGLVGWLTAAADVVLFSAAIPGQPGKGHVNPQRPGYWADLFAARGFARHDRLRGDLVHRAEVPYWYRQNLFLFAAPGVSLPPGRDFLPPELELVHAPILDRHLQPTVRGILGQLGPALAGAVRRRLGRG